MPHDRRKCRRHHPLATPWQPHALLRSGAVVQLLNVARCGALVEAIVRLRPGTRTTIQLSTGQQGCALAAYVVRCRVSTLSPLRYEAALAFDKPLEGLVERF